jgi:hypothetical protein
MIRPPARAALASAAAVLLAGCGGGDGSADGSKRQKVNPPAPVRGSDLVGLSRSLGQPVYWAGPRGASGFELTREGADRISVRYPPAPGAASGLVVGTYRVKDALGATRTGATSSGAKLHRLPRGGLAFATGNTDVHFAYPGSDIQVEVFDPAGRALALVRSGSVRPVARPPR